MVQLIAPTWRPTSGGLVETTLAGIELALALVLQPLAFTGTALALVGRHLTRVRDAIALIGDDVATIRRSAWILLPRERTLGGFALVVGVQPLQPSSLLVLALRFAMQIGDLPVQLAQARVGRLGHQVLGAFGRHALTGGPLSRAVAELLRAPSPLTMLLGPRSGHTETLPRAPCRSLQAPGPPRQPTNGRSAACA